MDENSKSPDWVDELYKEYKGSYDTSSLFHYFDKNILVNIDYILERISIDRPDLSIGKDDIIRFREKGLLTELKFEDGSDGYPIYCISRIPFLFDIINKWNYDFISLKNITDYEEDVIDFICNSDKIDYLECSDLEFLIAYLKNKIDDFESNAKEMHWYQNGTEVKVQIQKEKDALSFWEEKRGDELSPELKVILEKAVFGIKAWLEFSRFSVVYPDRAKAMLGFSPDTSFGCVSHGGDPTLKNEKDFQYSCEYEGMHCAFGGFSLPEIPLGTQVRFVATPDFMIGINDNGGIDIKIRNPQNVTTPYLRKIEKYYKCFRSILDVKRAGWGEKSGSRKIKAERDKFIKSRYNKLRQEKPSLSSDTRIEKILLEVKEKFQGSEISISTAKKVIYDSGILFCRIPNVSKKEVKD